MGILSIILTIIGAIVVLLVISAAASPDDYKIETDIIIARPVGTVFDYIKYLENQTHYNKWVMADPHVRKTFKGTDGTVGFFYAWESDNKQVGKGEQTITDIALNKRVDYRLRFIEPFKSEAESYIAIEALANGQTKVSWAFYGKRTFVMKLMHIVLSLQKMLKKDLHTSLVNLKGILEK